jgi:hypothetical protein
VEGGRKVVGARGGEKLMGSDLGMIYRW